MSDYITTGNLQLVVETNKRISNEIDEELLYLRGEETIDTL